MRLITIERYLILALDTEHLGTPTAMKGIKLGPVYLQALTNQIIKQARRVLFRTTNTRHCAPDHALPLIDPGLLLSCNGNVW